MARFYHVDIARFASDAEPKWVDNLLSHFDIPGVDGARQGLARRISAEGVYHIALIRTLSRGLGLSTGTAVSVAAQLLSSVDSRIDAGDGISLQLDREAFQRTIDAAIAEAVETIAPARRGRPPKRTIGS